MHLLKNTILATALLLSPVLAAPAETSDALPDQLQSIRAATVTCRPHTSASSTQRFIVEVDSAQEQARGAGFAAGKSGDPHGYENGDGISWGVHNCDGRREPLYEYPVYWRGAPQKAWKKDTKTSQQSPTPIRVVYANKNGGVVYCGVMIHETVTRDNNGQGKFLKCE